MANDYSSYAVAISVLTLLFLLKKIRRSKLPYPPGPKGSFLLGNVKDVPPSYEWLTYAQWSRELNSDLIHLNLAGTHVIVVNTHEAAFELFEKRSVIYSDRPRMPMIMELVGWDWSFSFFRYGPKWRAYRKLFHQHFNTNVVSQFNGHELKATHELLQRLVAAPDRFMDHIQLMAASLVLNISYGIDVQSIDDPYVINAEKTMSGLAEAGSPGAFMVDALPWLKYVPDWMPGTEFKAKAKVWKKYANDTADIPLKYAKDQIANGTNTPSLTSKFYENWKGIPNVNDEEMIRAMSAVIYVAGSDTTVSSIQSFFLAMVLYPEVFKKAQEEIERVVGRDRLPDFSDKDSLPYINAIVQESLRWNPVAPTGGTPHALSADDEYKGMFLPKGAIIVGNTWAILHDERMYPNGQAFIPERYLKDGKPNPKVRLPEAAFGFGRRMCPGRHMAIDSIYIAVATVTAAFNITKAVDSSGKDITPTGEFKSGFLSHPYPFQCSIKPRSQHAIDLIAEAHATHHPQD